MKRSKQPSKRQTALARKTCKARIKKIRTLAANRSIRKAEAPSQPVGFSPEQIADWLEENYRRLIGFAAALGCRTSKVAVHAAWLKAMPRYNPQYKYQPFFYQSLRWVVLDIIRDYYRHPAGEPLNEKHCADLISEGQASCNDHLAQVLSALLTRLPPHSVWLLRAHYCRGVSLKKLARHLGLPLAVVKMRLLRARRAALGIMRAKGCMTFARALTFDPVVLHRAMMPSSLRPARPQPRPTCRATHAKNL